MNEMLDTIKSVPKVVEEIYSDAASGTLQEASKIGVDAVKTIRLALFPLQLTAALQDRLSRYISQAIAQVPETQRVSPMESLILPVADKLKYQEEENPISRLFVNLLSRGMCRERLGEAHPAFINVISQLAPDEVILLDQLGRDGFKIYFRFNGKKAVVRRNQSDEYVRSLSLSEEVKGKLISKSIDPEAIAQPDFFLIFLEHLVSLGLVTYNNEITNNGELRGIPRDFTIAVFFCIELSEFGTLFYRACVRS